MTRVFIVAERVVGEQVLTTRKEIDLWLLRSEKISGNMLLVELEAAIKELDGAAYGSLK